MIFGDTNSNILLFYTGFLVYFLWRGKVFIRTIERTIQTYENFPVIGIPVCTNYILYEQTDDEQEKFLNHFMISPRRRNCTNFLQDCVYNNIDNVHNNLQNILNNGKFHRNIPFYDCRQQEYIPSNIYWNH
tara:strand:+ start:690 stop:1082 length:393 start_codon:yes stop_codon:yes gene_type:complete